MDEERLAQILGRERRQLHPLLRDQRAIAGIGRAHANEILRRAHLSPFKLSTELSSEEIGRLAATIRDNLTEAFELREQGKGDKDVYRVHNRLGEPCGVRDADRKGRLRGAHGLLLPTCQTGGRRLKDRRFSRLLR